MQDSEREYPPVLITEAAPSQDDQLAVRKRRYLITMGMRIPCLILAVVFVNTWWLMLLFVLISIPLPWIAVLRANDRPARRAERMSRFRGRPDSAGELESRDHPVIEV